MAARTAPCTALFRPGDVDLLAVEDVLVALFDSLSLDIREVRTAATLGRTHADEAPALGHTRQDELPQSLRPVLIDNGRPNDGEQGIDRRCLLYTYDAA